MCGGPDGDCRPIVLGPNAIFDRGSKRFPFDDMIDRIQRSGRVGDFPEVPSPFNDVPPTERMPDPCPCCGAIHKRKTLAERVHVL